jgi:hypothetical protein
MAATKSQGRAFGIFIVAATVTAIGLTYFSTGSGKAAFAAGLIGLIAALGIFLKIKPQEGLVPDGSQPVVLKLAGLATAFGGWLVVLFGLHLTASVSGRMITTLLGFGLSLVGILFLLPAAANKNAIWKA